MAKVSKSVSFKGAMIDLEEMKIYETTKDETFEYDLNSILQDWNGVEGISLSIKKDSDIDPEN